MSFPLTVLFFLFLLNSCTTFDNQQNLEPKKLESKKMDGILNSNIKKIIPNEAEILNKTRSKKIESGGKNYRETCKKIYLSDFEVPKYINSFSIFVTKLLDQCITKNKKIGFKNNFSWIGLGVPCTGGGGKISPVGKYFHPKMVRFSLHNTCSMIYNSRSFTEKMYESVGLPKSSKLLALYPLDVLLWKVIGSNEIDVGNRIELRSKKSLLTIWPKFIRKEPILVVLYGRENSWKRSGNIYRVNANLIKVRSRSFKLEIIRANIVSEEELKEVYKECMNLHPRRNCTQLKRFSS